MKTKPKTEYSAKERAEAQSKGKVIIGLPDLSSLNMAQIREFCREKGLYNSTKLKRDELIKYVIEAFNPDGTLKPEYAAKKARRKRKGSIGIPSYEKIVKPELERIKIWRTDGVTIEGIAELLGITKQTMLNYANRHKELREALEHSRVKLLTDLEHSMYQRALGLTNVTEEEVTEERIFNRITNQYEWVVTKRRKKVVTGRASDGLLIFTLKNLTRNEGKWLDARLVEALALAGKSNEELEELTKALNSLGYLNPSYETEYELDMEGKERVCTDED